MYCRVFTSTNSSFHWADKPPPSQALLQYALDFTQMLQSSPRRCHQPLQFYYIQISFEHHQNEASCTCLPLRRPSLHLHTIIRMRRNSFTCMHALTTSSYSNLHQPLSLQQLSLLVSNVENGTRFWTDDEVAARYLYAWRVELLVHFNPTIAMHLDKGFSSYASHF